MLGVQLPSLTLFASSVRLECVAAGGNLAGVAFPKQLAKLRRFVPGWMRP